ncbi:hypothetical protein F4212_08560 [Candidatus Poribacteria bacterium]|nr:hypothetical protein [Candidatus Poribacteria bacterium]
MYLEFIPEGSRYCPLVILYPSIPEEAEKLYQALSNLVADNSAVVDIHALPFISPVDGCRLSAQVSDKDIGAVLIENTENHFTWQLTRQEWEFALELLYPFTEPDYSGYQWLDDSASSEIAVLITAYNRQW